MKNELSLLEGFYFHCLDIRFSPSYTIQMPYWIGAVLRNRFLYATSQVVGKDGRTLFDQLDSLPISDSHPCYKTFAGGFPKGYWFDCTTLLHAYSGFTLEEDKVYTFSLIIVGKLAQQVTLFIEALQKMCSEGIGRPKVPLTLIDVKERSGSLLFAEGKILCDTLSHPIKWHYCGVPTNENVSITLKLHTPVSLFSRNRKSKNGMGYQDKMNQFPSFYQFMRSVVYRLLTLNMLYVNSDAIASAESIEAFVAEAANAMLMQANIRYVTRNSTPKVGANNVYTMGGYCGTLTFGQVSSFYLPLLLLGSFVGVGNDINFGLGQFEVNY